MNLNKVFLLGRLTADPQLRTTASGTPVGTFAIATNRFWTDKNSGKKEETQFHNIVVWGRQADIAQRFLQKGGLVLVEGRMQTRSWEGRDGQKRWTTEVVVDNIQLGPRASQPGGGSGGFGTFSAASPNTPASSVPAPSSPESSIPVINLDAENPPVPEPASDDHFPGEIKPEDLNF